MDESRNLNCVLGEMQEMFAGGLIQLSCFVELLATMRTAFLRCPVPVRFVSFGHLTSKWIARFSADWRKCRNEHIVQSFQDGFQNGT